jgi:hypothetical protein
MNILINVSLVFILLYSLTDSYECNSDDSIYIFTIQRINDYCISYYLCIILFIEHLGHKFNKI